MAVVSRLESRHSERLQNVFFAGNFRSLLAVGHEEVANLLFSLRVKVLAPHQGVGRDHGGGPDHLHLVVLRGVGDLEAIQTFVVIGGNVDLLVRCRQQIGLMVSRPGEFEIPFRINFVLRKRVITRHQKPGGRIGITIAQCQRLAVAHHIFERLEGAVLMGHQV